MTRKIAFYAPMKSPHHAVPSGDRTVARNLLSALSELGDVFLVSEFQSRDGVGDASVQANILRDARAEVDRLVSQGDWDAWVTYHNYYKAPDLIGPAVCSALGIPYHQIEASRSKKRLSGPWAQFAQQAEAACDAASVVYYFTQRDRPALEAGRVEGQRLIHLRPFLNWEVLPQLPARSKGSVLLAVGMFRAGDKLASYSHLAQALHKLDDKDWVLRIVGGGPEEENIKALFNPFGERISFLGEMGFDAVLTEMANADVFVWPGVNEAFGMVYLEAQAMGLPIVAENRDGVRDVIGPSSVLVPQNDAVAFAQGIKTAISGPRHIAEHRSYVTDHHLRVSAVAVLRETMDFKA